jgi:hypothetical protein
MSELDKDWEEIAAKINFSIKKAAEAFAEVNKLAAEAGLPGLIYTQWIRENLEYDQRSASRTGGKPLTKEEINQKCEELQEKFELIDVGPLESAIEDGGWSTSSSYC